LENKQLSNSSFPDSGVTSLFFHVFSAMTAKATSRKQPFFGRIVRESNIEARMQQKALPRFAADSKPRLMVVPISEGERGASGP
jgi:hypothetical protein